MSVSVAMCTFNGAAYLREQLDSIRSQDRLPDELIISDDLSSDSTLEILNSFRQKSPFPVRILSNAERVGPSQNFARVIAAAAGDVIILADQDDVWRPSKIRSMVAAIDGEPRALFAFSDAGIIDQYGCKVSGTLWQSVGLSIPPHSADDTRMLELLLRHNVIPGASIAFRSKLRRAILPIPVGWMHDYWIVLLGLILGTGLPIEKVLFDYRRHVNQTCGWRKKTFRQVCADSVLMAAGDAWTKVEVFRELKRRLLVIHSSKELSYEALRVVSAKEEHLVRRAQTRNARGISRVVGVVREVSTGRYQRFSNSWYSIIRDL